MRYVVLPVLENLGYDLVEVALVSEGRRILRVFIDRREGLSVEDCARASKALSAELDQHDLLGGRYYLEVSSPGAERKLKTPEDFGRFVGRKAKVTFREPDGRVAEKVGRIESFRDEAVVLQVDGSAEVNIPLGSILTARLAI
jgi:ribosome maturation factor RimP